MPKSILTEEQKKANAKRRRRKDIIDPDHEAFRLGQRHALEGAGFNFPLKWEPARLIKIPPGLTGWEVRQLIRETFNVQDPCNPYWDNYIHGYRSITWAGVTMDWLFDQQERRFIKQVKEAAKHGISAKTVAKLSGYHPRPDSYDEHDPYDSRGDRHN